jgi:mono/diheme cytochrome c family protein
MVFKIRFYLLLLVVLILAACGGLGGEPRIVATIAPPTPFPENFAYRANLANGAAVYAANCVRCHGIGGAGDGELVQSGQVQNIPNFTDLAARIDQSPQDYFNVITNGRIENLMPPWRDALSEEQRWDVAFYTYSLAYTPEQLTIGRELSTAWANLISGEAYGTGAPTLSDSEFVAQFTEAAPDDAAAMTSEQMLSLVAHTRLLPLGGQEVVGQVAQVPTPVATEEATAAPTVAPVVTNAGTPNTITGRVIHGTAFGTVPPDTIVTLHIVNPDFTTETTMNANIAPDGSFFFNGIQFLDGANFFISVPYQNRLFASETVQSDANTRSMDLPVTIYDLTEDTSVIRIVGMVTQISESVTGDGLEFLQVIRFRNNSDRLFTTTLNVGESGFASVVVQLPPGSVVLGLQGGEDRYVVLQEQSTIVDTLPVLPNEDHLMQLLYLVPYSRGAIIDQQVNYGLDGPVRILINDNSAITLTSNQLAALGPELIGERQFESYGGDLMLQAGGVVSYTLDGQIGAQSSGIGAGNLLPLLMIIAGSVLLGFIIVTSLRQRYAPRTRKAAPKAAPPAPADKNKLIDALVRQIAELDEQHDKGEINHDLYHQRRTKLKARLAELMDEKS